MEDEGEEEEQTHVQQKDDEKEEDTQQDKQVCENTSTNSFSIYMINTSCILFIMIFTVDQEIFV